MTELESTTPTQDERVMAALSHISAVLPLMGTLAPLIIWVTQKDKSKYVAFQSLQALAYQLTMILAYFVGMACYMCSFFGMFLSIPIFAASGNSEPPGPLFGLGAIIPFIVFGAIMIGGLAFVVYGVVGAVMVFQGKDFRYVLIGARIERFMYPEHVTVEGK